MNKQPKILLYLLIYILHRVDQSDTVGEHKTVQHCYSRLYSPARNQQYAVSTSLEKLI